MPIIERIKKGWNAFMGREPPQKPLGYATSYRPDKKQLSTATDRTILASVYNRIAMDVAAVDVNHVHVNQNEILKDVLKDSFLNQALTTEANLDQTGREFIQDLTLSMFDEGCVGAVPTYTDFDPNMGAYEVKSLRTGQIMTWYPHDIRVKVYDEDTGQKKEITMSKRAVAIITNPFYEVMNKQNSTLKRLTRKIAILDAIDDRSSTGKLDLIIQLPYVIKTPQRREQAEIRRKDIEKQLNESKYGIAYTDGTERITQLGRSLDNNLQSQIEYLTSMLFSQLGINQSILDGTADEKTMLNYNSRTVAPILVAITEEMTRKFLTKTARTQGQRVKFMQNPFKLVPISQIADIADKFTRSEILSSNELRSIVGFMPVDSPQADELRNSNLNRSPYEEMPASTNPDAQQEINEGNYPEYEGEQIQDYENQNEELPEEEMIPAEEPMEEPEPEPKPQRKPRAPKRRKKLSSKAVAKLTMSELEELLK